MRKRFPIETYTEFKDALAGKKAIQLLNNPDPNDPEDTRTPHAYQIRKYANGFRLVERLNSTEAAVINDSRYGPKRKKKKHSAVIL